MRWLPLAVPLALAVAPAFACTVCIDPPERALADRLLEADAVVIAREDPARPFRYLAVEALEGAAGPAPIPLLVDSGTRRRLSARPEGGVLLLRDDDGWSPAGWADPVWRGTAEAVLAARSGWEAAPERRFAFFEGLLHSSDARLRRLAIDELSRAPYGRVRAIARPIPGDEARRALADRSMLPWSGFHVLMLGLSERAEDHALVRGRVAAAARRGGGRDLDAWATALVEIDGAAGVSRLAADWLEAPGRPAEDLRAVIAALAVQAGEGDPALRAPILAALHALPTRRPEVGGSVAAALGTLGDFSQAEAIERAMLTAARREGVDLDEPELFAASLYAGRARMAGAGPSPDTSTKETDR